MIPLAAPTRADLEDLGTLMSTTAPPEFEDENGHVNVRHHYGLLMHGTEVAFRDQLGVTAQWLERTGQSTFSIAHHVQFHSEILVGHELSLHHRVLGRSAKVIHAMGILFDRTTDRVASTVEYVEAYVDLGTRRTTTMPAELTIVLDDLLQRHERLSWDLPRSRELGTARPRPSSVDSDVNAVKS